MKNNKDFAFIKREFEAIAAYEKTQNTPFLSSTRILKHFGAENICAIYGCTIVSDTIAHNILYEVLKAQ
jgi:hypothetical protein